MRRPSVAVPHRRPCPTRGFLSPPSEGADWPANCRGSCSTVGHVVHAQDSPVTCRDVRTNAAQQVLRGTHRRHARRVLAGAREAPAGGCSSSGRGSDGKCTLLINRSVVTSPSSLRTSTSAQIAQTAERQLCSRRRLTGDADAAARTAPVGRDGMCTPASRLGPQGGSGRGEQAKVTFGPVLSYPVHIPTSTTHNRLSRHQESVRNSSRRALLRITAACCGTAIGIATACAILGVALRFSDQSLV